MTHGVKASGLHALRRVTMANGHHTVQLVEGTLPFRGVTRELYTHIMLAGLSHAACTAEWEVLLGSRVSSQNVGVLLC